MSMKASSNRPPARPSPPPASSMPSTWAPVMTGFVVASQLAFVVTAYSHAYLDFGADAEQVPHLGSP